MTPLALKNGTPDETAPAAAIPEDVKAAFSAAGVDLEDLKETPSGAHPERAPFAHG